MFICKDRYSILSKTIAWAIVCLFLYSDISYCQPSIATLAPLAASENPKIKREITASMYRASRLIWLANSPRYLDLLARYNALAMLLPSGRYLMAPETAANDLILIRSVIHEDNEILMQQEEKLRSTRYNKLMREILSRDDIMKLYRAISHYKELNKQPDSIIFNDLIAKAFEILSIIDENLVYPSELKPEEKEFITLMRPILQAKDSRNRYKNFSQVFFDIDRRTKAIKALQENKDERFYRVANTDVAEGEMRQAFEDKSSALGGKSFWSQVIENLASRIGYRTISSTYITIQELWSRFIEINQELVDEGNKLITSDPRISGEVSEETKSKLRKIARRFKVPTELEGLIRSRTESLKGWVIDRSSGKWEDSFVRNLAGIFISPKKRDERLVTQGIKEIFDNAINRIWISQNGKNPVEGLPNTLSEKEGFGVVIQPFISFEASGTAMSNLYGHTAIEAVIGDADTAVRSIHANVTQFLFRKGQEPQAGVFEYNPTFLTTPYEFRVKGKGYCAAKNQDEMQQVISSYHRINGNFSPISADRAIELNRVVNALESEVGVPLDVEWGILDGELYIIQIRPIIGNFRKPLVEISPTLKGKTAIAQTPIALGHTQGEGFTGKMILFSDGVSQDEIARFEQEVGEDYIRVQSDVASSILGRKTRAKVLVDPDQGSRQAHNINLISSRITSGEFTYTNGPIIKNGLLKNLDFIAYPGFDGIWIAKEQVTCYSDGLRAVFYKGDEKTLKLTKNESADLHTRRLSDICDLLLTLTGETSLSTDRERVEHILNQFSLHHFDYLMQYAFPGSEQGMDMETFVKKIEDTHMGIETFFIQTQFLETVLGFPLWPNEWEVSWLSALSKTRQFLFEYKEYEKKGQTKEPRPLRTEFRALIYDYHLSEYRSIEQALAKQENCRVHRIMGPTHETPQAVDSIQDYTHATSDHWRDFEDNLRQFENDVDFVLLHFGNKDNASRINDMVRQVKRKNPEALIVVVGRVPEGMIESLADQGQIIFMPQESFSCDSVIKMAEQKYAGWKEKQNQVKKERRIERPEYPEKLRVLIVHDDELYRVQFGESLQDKLGSGEYEFILASNIESALETVGDQKIDLCFADWAGTNIDERNYLSRLRTMFGETVYGLHILTAYYDHDNVKERILKSIRLAGFAQQESISTMDPHFELQESRIQLVRQARQRQVEQYEQKLAEWEAAQSKAPIKPEGISVLFVTDDPDNEFYVNSYFGKIADAKVKICSNAAEAIEYIKSNKVDVLIADYNIPMVQGETSEDTTYSDSNVRAILTTAKETAEANNRNVALVTFSAWFEKHQERALKGISESIQLFRATEPGLFQKFVDVIKQTQQKLIEDYDRAFAQWQASQQKPRAMLSAKPAKLRMLFADDDEDIIEDAAAILGADFNSEEYEFYYARTYDECLLILEQHAIDAAIFDLNMAGDDSVCAAFGKKLENIPQVTVVSAFPSEDRIKNDVLKRCGKAVANKAAILTKPYEVVWLNQEIKTFRQHQLDDWDTTQTQTSIKTQEKETIFIVNNFSQEASDLAEFIKETFGDKFNIVTMDSMFMLDRALHDNAPVIVITDMFIDNNDALDSVFQKIGKRSPSAKYIVTSEEAAITSSERFNGKNVVGIAEKPFYFQNVIAILKGLSNDLPDKPAPTTSPPTTLSGSESVKQAFSALDSEARRESQIGSSVSRLRGTSQNLMEVNKFKFCLPIEVLRNSPDIALALNSTGLLKQKPQDAENIEFELVVTGVTEEDVNLIEGLNRDDIKKALNLPNKFTVSIITEAQIQETAQRFGYDASNPKNRVAIVKDFFSGALAKGEYMAIVTDALDTTEKADLLKEELEKELKAELSQENISIRVLVRPESGKSMYSLSKIINDWLEAINQGNFSTISRILPIPAPLTPELERAIRTAWAVLTAA